ncbi:MAG: hypothetical protein ACRDK5_08410 [Solirubrobacterales bacterium]
MEQATAEGTKRRFRLGQQSPIAERVEELRSLAKKENYVARDATWAWFKELGEHRDQAALDEIFALGKAPKGLDGPTDGILVVPLIQGVFDRGLTVITKAWMPWNGKRFDAPNNRGDNLLAGTARWPAKLIWPRYETKPVPGGRAAFDFETRIEPGKHDPDTEVLVIDYAPVSDNPDHLIRSIRDELVEVAGGAHLGKILYRTGEDSYRNLGFFALRPAG